MATTLAEIPSVTETVLKTLWARNESHAWVKLLWDEKTGWVHILSDYGNWAYYWGHRGEKTVAEFLLQLDHQYMGKKMIGEGYFEFSLDKTVEDIRVYLANMFDEGLDEVTVESEKSLLEQLKSGEIDFRYWCDETSVEVACEFARTEQRASA
jgi:hypothetical protein